MVNRFEEAHEAIARLRVAAGKLQRTVAFMEVCGTHTVNAFRSGLHTLMPENVRLLSGPGCPVCVTSQGDIDRMIALADQPRLTVCTYGDMLRVTGSRGSLEMARGRGADVRVIYSSIDAVKLATAEPKRCVVLAAVGFETTTPATAAAVLAASALGLANFFVLVSHKRIIPAMRALLDSGRARVDGFLCPGHVAVIIGAEAFRPIVDRYALPCVIAGFEDVQIAAALARLAELTLLGSPALENEYPQAVTPGGNSVAREMIEAVFEPVDVTWRALGVIPRSGLAIRPQFQSFDAAHRFGLAPLEIADPLGCRCGDIITGLCTPDECKLFAGACTPTRPVGPCMVSSEGPCQAWFKYNRGKRHTAATRNRISTLTGGLQ